MVPLPPRGRGRAPSASLVALLLIGLVPMGCRAPAVRSVPLETPGLPARLDRARALSPATPTSSYALRFSAAVGRLREHNPRVVEARAAALPAQALARTPVPMPNPRLALGPILLSGVEGVRSVAWGVESALGWTLQLGGKRQMLNGLNAQAARSANVRAITVEREEYLGLRHRWIEAAIGAHAEAVRARLLEATREARDGVAEVAKARSSTAVDVVLLDLDVRRLDADQVDAEAEATAARAALAQAIGARTADVAAPSMTTLPPLPAEVHPLERLRAIAIAGHPALDRLRAEYAVAEQRLRLEASRAIPDLDLAGTYERDDGRDGPSRFGLPLGIELPIFDRNQPAVAEACATRDAIRGRFEATCTRILGEIEGARAVLLRRRDRARRFDVDLEPAAREALDTGRQALIAGETDALRYIDLLRSTRDVEREQVQATREVYLAWTTLEQAVGGPLLRFPDEPAPTPTPITQEDDRCSAR